MCSQTSLILFVIQQIDRFVITRETFNSAKHIFHENRFLNDPLQKLSIFQSTLTKNDENVIVIFECKSFSTDTHLAEVILS
jgi:hypothetical protein